MYLTNTVPDSQLVDKWRGKIRSFRLAIGLVGLCSLITAGNASAQTAPPADQIVYTTGTAALPSSTSSTGQLLFNSVPQTTNVLPMVEWGATPSLFVQKPNGQHGIFIVDNDISNNDHSYTHPLNIELFNVTEVDNALRGGIRVHVDPSDTLPSQGLVGNLAGVLVGNHGPHTSGLYLLTFGSPTIPTQGIGIVNQSWGKAGIWNTEGDPNNITSTEGAVFIHQSTGHILDLNHSASSLSADFIHANATADGTGSFTGNFLDFNVTGSQVFKVDASGNVTIPSLKATSGTRYVCIDTNGKLVSQTTVCSGT